MPSNLVGRVHFTSTLDGAGTERDAEQIGAKAGKAAGQGYDKNWSRSFRDTLTESGKKSFDAWQKSGEKDGGVYGSMFTKRMRAFRGEAMKVFEGIRLDPGFMDDFAKKFDDAGLAAGRLQVLLRSLDGQIDNIELDKAARQVDDWAESQRRAAADTNRLADEVDAQNAVIQHQAEVFKRSTEIQERSRQERIEGMLREGVEWHEAATNYNNELERMRESRHRTASDSEKFFVQMIDGHDRLRRIIQGDNDEMGRFSLHWRDLSHNTRQWTLIIGAVLAAMEDLAVLGSAAGGGLVALGGAITSNIIGLGGVAATFVTLNKELDELPAHLRPVAAEFQDFKGVFSELRETIATGAFAEMGGSFGNLGRSLRNLQPELLALGTSVGDVFDKFTENTVKGTDAFDIMRKSLALAGPNFEATADAAGTLGLALLNSFNKAQPMVAGLIKYVDLLAERFDAFVRGNGFDQWMRNATQIFEHLGPLLDATGRALNDLVTPESVQRTTEFLDNLTGFMPNLQELLTILGRLDVFGLAAQLLNDFGRAMEPLAEPIGDLAAAISRIASVIIGELAESLGVIAGNIAPLVQELADFAGAIPEDVLRGIANGVLTLAGAFVVLKGAQGIAGAATALIDLRVAADAAAVSGGALGKTLKGLGAAGLWGAIAAGAFIGFEAVKNLAHEISGVDEVSQELIDSNASLGDSFKRLQMDAQGNMIGETIDDWHVAIEGLAGTGDIFKNLGSIWTDMGHDGLALAGALEELDSGMASLASMSLPQAATQFANWMQEIGASRAEMQTILGHMPEFTAALEAQGINVAALAGSQDLLNQATGAGSVEQQIAAQATQANNDALAELEGRSASTGESIDALADKIRGFGSATLTTRDAQRDLEAAFDDLDASIATNTATVNISEAAGRANEAAIDSAAKATLEYAAATVEMTGDHQQANKIIADGRERLKETLKQFNITGDAADAYADALGLVPENVPTAVYLTGAEQAESTLNHIARNRSMQIHVTTTGDVRVGNRFVTPMASGGVLHGPSHILAGEAGAEAIVPLDRPLHMVDKSVRALAAFAQGMQIPNMASGGVVTGQGRMFAEGAIVVNDRSGDSRRTAQETVNRIFERVGS